MSSNRVQYFIRNILQNSKLNREKFVKNIKTYTKRKQNHNLILKKNFNTNSYGFPPPNNNNNNNNNNSRYFMIFVGGAIIYIHSERFNKK